MTGTAGRTIILYMRNTIKIIKSYTIDPELDEYVAATKGKESASERVNELLRLAMIQEQNDKLESEAAAFFSVQQKDRKDELAFQKAALHTFERD